MRLFLYYILCQWFLGCHPHHFLARYPLAPNAGLGLTDLPAQVPQSFPLPLSQPLIPGFQGIGQLASNLVDRPILAIGEINTGHLGLPLFFEYIFVSDSFVTTNIMNVSGTVKKKVSGSAIFFLFFLDFSD